MWSIELNMRRKKNQIDQHDFYGTIYTFLNEETVLLTRLNLNRLTKGVDMKEKKRPVLIETK